MIKRNNKKGFTIVELVIVIAVIAILAAVLIPTFTGIIKKANLSADQQAVRQMNTSLAMAGEINGSEEMIAALDEAGYNSQKTLVPVSKGYYFFYVPAENIVVLVDADKKVVFPENAECYGSTVPADSYNLIVGLTNIIPTDGNSLADAIANAANGKSIGIVGAITAEEAIEVNGYKTFNAQAGSALTVPSIAVKEGLAVIGENATLNTSFVLGDLNDQTWSGKYINIVPNPKGENRIALKNDSDEALFTVAVTTAGGKASVAIKSADITLANGQKLISFSCTNSGTMVSLSADSTINGVKVSEMTEENFANIVEGPYYYSPNRDGSVDIMAVSY